MESGDLKYHNEIAPSVFSLLLQFEQNKTSRKDIDVAFRDSYSIEGAENACTAKKDQNALQQMCLKIRFSVRAY